MAPRECDLQAVLHNMFPYLNTHNRSTLVLDPSFINHGVEQDCHWAPFYPDAREEIPANAPKPLGKAVQVTVFVDSEHAGDLITRHSWTGILIYVNRAPIIWYSKCQNSVETSTFGWDFTALKTGIEMIKGLRFKTYVMGVPLDGPAHVRIDNMSVVNNTLRKKSNAVAYHFVRENVASEMCHIVYEPSQTNLADILTKLQTEQNKRDLCQ